MSNLLAIGTKVSISDYFRIKASGENRETIREETYEGRHVEISRQIIWSGGIPSILDKHLPIEDANREVYRHGIEVRVNGHHYTSAANMEHAEGIIRRWKRDVDSILDNTY